MKKESDTLMQPYVIHIENTNNEEINNISIFFSYSSLNKKFNADGNLEENGLIISSIKDVSYKQILEHLCSSKIRIGLTTITSETENNNRNFIEYKYYGTNGHRFSKILVLLSNNYLIDSENSQPYVVDGSVALIVNSIEPNSKLTLSFYPKNMEECNDVLIIQNTVDKLINREV